MQLQSPVASAAPSSAALVKDTTTTGFRQDVIAESAKQPVLVDFWAPWCGPCKQLTPVLEKVVNAAGGKVRLVKMNIDEHPQIPGQLGIQSIPAVIAFQRGQPVDGFMGALPEGQVTAFIERLVGPLGPTAVDELLAEAAAFTEEGDTAGATELYAAILEQEPENLQALAALAKLQLDAGNIEAAQNFLAMAPEDKANDPLIASVRAAIELAESAAELGDLTDLQRRVETDGTDWGARYDLALGFNARNQREEAIDQLIAVVRGDRTWNEDGARKQLLLFFEAWGPMDPATILGRRRLSTLLFS